jgi:hypothetical protein
MRLFWAWGCVAAGSLSRGFRNLEKRIGISFFWWPNTGVELGNWGRITERGLERAPGQVFI